MVTTRQIIFAFHACGTYKMFLEYHVAFSYPRLSDGSDGFACSYPLPTFVADTPDVWYTDKSSATDKSVVEIFSSDALIFGSYSAYQIYKDNIAGVFTSKVSKYFSSFAVTHNIITRTH
jgi:hypothetical protein